MLNLHYCLLKLFTKTKFVLFSGCYFLIRNLAVTHILFSFQPMLVIYPLAIHHLLIPSQQR